MNKSLKSWTINPISLKTNQQEILKMDAIIRFNESEGFLRWFDASAHLLKEFWPNIWELYSIYKNLWIDHFDSNYVEYLVDHPEIIKTYLAMISVWWVYLYLIPWLINLIAYWNKPTFWYKLRIRIIEELQKNWWKL